MPRHGKTKFKIWLKQGHGNVKKVSREGQNDVKVGSRQCQGKVKAMQAWKYNLRSNYNLVVLT